MMRKQKPRISEVGQCIRRIVTEQPGIHFRGLGRAANLSSAGQLRHHLDRLERQGVLIEIEDGRYKRFFVAGEHDPKLRPEIARFARVVPRRIAKLLLINPMNRTELRRSLGCADSTLGYHLARMVMLGDLAKSRGANCCRYSLTSEELVRKMLVMQGAGAEITPDAGLLPAPAPRQYPCPAPNPTTTPSRYSRARPRRRTCPSPRAPRARRQSGPDLNQDLVWASRRRATPRAKAAASPLEWRRAPWLRPPEPRL